MKLMTDAHHEKELDVDDEDEKSSSECSSGCQSGWTMYLDHSNGSKAISMQQQHHQHVYIEEEEDLSMVSDASSGPPHFHDDDDEDDHCCCGGSKKQRINTDKQQQHITKQERHISSLLDDTASSPLFSFSETSCNATATNSSNNKQLQLFDDEDVLELSCGFSATQFKGKSALRKHLGYFKSCAPIKPTSVSKEEGSENCGDSHRIQAFSERKEKKKDV